MIMQIVAVRDSRSELFSQPVFVPAVGVGVRALADVVNGDKSHDYARHPDDFTLFHIGTYDDSTGVLTAFPGGHVNLGLLTFLKETK